MTGERAMKAFAEMEPVAQGAVKAEMERLTAPLQERLEFVKNPAVLESKAMFKVENFDLQTVLERGAA